jgi:hypothetical protein
VPADGERPDDPTVLESAISTPGAPQGGFNEPLAIGGVALGVLALGAVIGLLLRRRQSA